MKLIDLFFNGVYVTFSSLVGGRLKETRKALGLNQAEIAKSVGVSREYWGRCERGVSVPGGEVLAALALKGADVVYVLTGQRTGSSPAPRVMSAEEQTMLDYFRAAQPVARRAAMGALLGAAQTTSMLMSHLGNDNIQVGNNARVCIRKSKI